MSQLATVNVSNGDANNNDENLLLNLLPNLHGFIGDAILRIRLLGSDGV
jgi:hypothetical protein